MTDRVKAGCVAAVRLAIENAHDPDVLEATLQMGKLEGTWALVFDRREQVYASHIDAIAALWRKVAMRVDLQLAVRRFRDSLGLSTEAFDITDHRQMAARAVAAAVIASIAGQDSSPTDREQLIAALVAALRAGYIEGMVGALAVSAEQDGVEDDIDLDAAYAAIDSQLNDHLFQHRAIALLAEVAAAVGVQLARVLGNTSDSDDFEDTLEMAQWALGISSVPSVLALLIDFAIGQMVTAGIQALYQRYHVEQVQFVTAGDDKVCPQCEAAELDGPYARDEAPEPPLHYRCRCVLVATGELPAEAYDEFQ